MQDFWNDAWDNASVWGFFAGLVGFVYASLRKPMEPLSSRKADIVLEAAYWTFGGGLFGVVLEALGRL